MSVFSVICDFLRRLVDALVFANSPLGDDAVSNLSSLAETRFRRIGAVKPFLPLLREMVAVFCRRRTPAGCNQSGRVREYRKVQ
jgi:hypothetical protein